MAMAPPDTEVRNRSLEERVSRLEGGFEHLATKADIERVINAVQVIRTEFHTEIGNLRTEFRIEIERNRTEIERVRTEFRTESERNRTEIERVRAEVERNRADIIKMIVQIAGVGMALMAVGFAFLRLTGTA